MIYNELGKSGVKVSAISFGAWAIGGWMWGGASQADALKAIEASVNMGITTIDTAPVYGFGLSEEIVGEAVMGLRDEVQILTKFGLRWDTKEGQFFFASQDNHGRPIDIHRFSGKESIIQECEQSLRRLRTDYIDLYQIHWSDATTSIDETFEAVAQLLRDGKIRAAGVCNYSVEQMKEAEKTVEIVTNQVYYNMLVRQIEQDVVPYCLETGKGVLAYSPLERGLLTGKITDDYQFNEGDNRPETPLFQPDNRRRVNAFLTKLRPIAESKNATIGQVVINWTIQQPAIASALVGARDPKQAEENAKALDFMLSTEEINQINTWLRELNTATA